MNACVELSSLPMGGLECDSFVYLEAQSATASMPCMCINVSVCAAN